MGKARKTRAERLAIREAHHANYLRALDQERSEAEAFDRECESIRAVAKHAAYGGRVADPMNRAIYFPPEGRTTFDPVWYQVRPVLRQVCSDLDDPLGVKVYATVFVGYTNGVHRARKRPVSSMPTAFGAQAPVAGAETARIYAPSVPRSVKTPDISIMDEQAYKERGARKGISAPLFAERLTAERQVATQGRHKADRAERKLMSDLRK